MTAPAPSIHRPKVVEICYLNAVKFRGGRSMVPPMGKLDFEEAVDYATLLESLVDDIGVLYRELAGGMFLQVMDFIAHLETVLEDAGQVIEKPGIAMEQPYDNREHEMREASKSG
jgi:hypothetical protein